MWFCEGGLSIVVVNRNSHAPLWKARSSLVVPWWFTDHSHPFPVARLCCCFCTQTEQDQLIDHLLAPDRTGRMGVVKHLCFENLWRPCNLCSYGIQLFNSECTMHCTRMWWSNSAKRHTNRTQMKIWWLSTILLRAIVEIDRTYSTVPSSNLLWNTAAICWKRLSSSLL